jgi:predicted nucleic acid-binding protein
MRCTTVPIADVFVDTNVLIYARDTADPHKQLRAAEWMVYLWRTGRGRLSVQVLNEFYYVVTQKLKPGMDIEAARRETEQLATWDPIELTSAVLQRAWQVQDEFAISFWDGLIVAAAQIARCRYLLTEDLQDGQSLGGVMVVNPFLHVPDEVALP